MLLTMEMMRKSKERGVTVLCNAGKSLRCHCTTAQVIEQMRARSGWDKTFLMIGAKSGDQMTFKSCVQAAQGVLEPEMVSAAIQRMYVGFVDVILVFASTTEFRALHARITRN